MSPDEGIRKAFGQRFKQIRKYRGFIQAELALKLKVNKAEISRIENAKRSPKFSKLVSLANVFEIPVLHFFSEELELPLPHTGQAISLNPEQSVSSRAQRSAVQNPGERFIPLKITEEKQRFGLRLQNIRKNVNQSQVEIEVLSGVTHSDISRFENGQGNIELNTIAILAHALEVKVADLFDYDGPLPDNTNFKGKIRD